MDEDTKNVKLYQQVSAFSNKSHYSCKLCKYETKYSQDIKRHSIIHTQTIDERKQFKCDQCGSKYRDKRDLKVHIQSKHEDTKLSCNLCTFQSNSVNTFRYHYNLVHRGISHKCNICDKIVSHKGNLKIHMERNHNIKKEFKNETESKIACQLCTFKSDETSLKLHFTKVHEGLCFQCVLCKTEFSSEDDLNQHVQNSHQNDDDHHTKDPLCLELREVTAENIFGKEGIAEKSCFKFPIDQVKSKFDIDIADNLTEFQTKLNSQTLSENGRKKSKNIEKFQCTICPYVPSSKSLYVI